MQPRCRIPTEAERKSTPVFRFGLGPSRMKSSTVVPTGRREGGTNSSHWRWEPIISTRGEVPLVTSKVRLGENRGAVIVSADEVARML